MRETRLWQLHLFSALALIVLLSVHMGVQHYEKILTGLGLVGENVRDFASVAGRAGSAWWNVLYVLLLGFALYHGLYGTRRILHEVWYSRRATRVIDTLVVVFGLAVFIYGLWGILQATRMGGAL